ncbi:MAG: hypothetical protein CMO01_05220 [Thalassobius sp.]|nr:hypothetical protein [Thalassovita sp.]
MEELDIMEIWKGYESKLNETLQINRQNTLELTKMKIKSHLVSLKPTKIFTILAGIIWVVFLDIIAVVAFYAGNISLLISAVGLTIINKLAIGVYLYHLFLISKVGINSNVMEVQDKLARLKVSTLNITKILFLQFPLWTIFYWGWGMIQYGNPILWVIQLAITFASIYLSYWLYINIKTENQDKKWFKLIFVEKEWQAVLKSQTLLEQIEDYKNY